MATDEYLLDLSTEVIPAKKFMVDGKEYELYALEHLSEADEVNVVALFARYGQLAAQLGNAPNTDKAKKISQLMRDMRVNILAVLTSVPKATLRDWPLGVATKLMNAVESVMGEGEDTDDDGEDA